MSQQSPPDEYTTKLLRAGDRLAQFTFSSPASGEEESPHATESSLLPEKRRRHRHSLHKQPLPSSQRGPVASLTASIEELVGRRRTRACRASTTALDRPSYQRSQGSPPENPPENATTVHSSDSLVSLPIGEHSRHSDRHSDRSRPLMGAKYLSRGRNSQSSALLSKIARSTALAEGVMSSTQLPGRAKARGTASTAQLPRTGRINLGGGSGGGGGGALSHRTLHRTESLPKDTSRAPSHATGSQSERLHSSESATQFEQSVAVNGVTSSESAESLPARRRMPGLAPQVAGIHAGTSVESLPAHTQGFTHAGRGAGIHPGTSVESLPVHTHTDTSSFARKRVPKQSVSAAHISTFITAQSATAEPQETHLIPMPEGNNGRTHLIHNDRTRVVVPSVNGATKAAYDDDEIPVPSFMAKSSAASSHSHSALPARKAVAPITSPSATDIQQTLVSHRNRVSGQGGRLREYRQASQSHVNLRHVQGLQHTEQPRLLRKMRMFLAKHLPGEVPGVPDTARNAHDGPALSTEARLHVYAQCFDMFIQGFRSYAPILQRIKRQYEVALDKHAEKLRLLPQLTTRLATYRRESRFQQESAERRHNEEMQEAHAQMDRMKQQLSSRLTEIMEGYRQLTPNVNRQTDETVPNVEANGSDVPQQTDQTVPSVPSDRPDEPLISEENNALRVECESLRDRVDELRAQVTQTQGQLDMVSAERDTLKVLLDRYRQRASAAPKPTALDAIAPDEPAKENSAPTPGASDDGMESQGYDSSVTSDAVHISSTRTHTATPDRQQHSLTAEGDEWRKRAVDAEQREQHMRSMFLDLLQLYEAATGRRAAAFRRSMTTSSEHLSASQEEKSGDTERTVNAGSEVGVGTNVDHNQPDESDGEQSAVSRRDKVSAQEHKELYSDNSVVLHKELYSDNNVVLNGETDSTATGGGNGDGVKIDGEVTSPSHLSPFSPVPDDKAVHTPPHSTTPPMAHTSWHSPTPDAPSTPYSTVYRSSAQTRRAKHHTSTPAAPSTPSHLFDEWIADATSAASPPDDGAVFFQ